MIFAWSLLAQAALVSAAWRCNVLQTKEIHAGVSWTTQNCTMSETAEPDLTVNSITVDLKRSDLRVVAAAADPVAQVQVLPDIAASSGKKFIAGINGGYFWRVDTSGFWRDNVCRGKTRDEANTPVSAENVNYGIGL